MKRIPLGQRVKVCNGSGIESGVTGVIIDRRNVPTDGRGIPQLLGHYRPVNWKREYAIRDDTGRVFTMFGDRLTINN